MTAFGTQKQQNNNATFYFTCRVWPGKQNLNSNNLLFSRNWHDQRAVGARAAAKA